jgi:YHS domain-containing protein
MNDSEPSGPTLKDPVCGMEVNPGSPFQATYEGGDCLFCSRWEVIKQTHRGR